MDRLKQANYLQGEEDPDEIRYYRKTIFALTITSFTASMINMTLLLVKSSSRI